MMTTMAMATVNSTSEEERHGSVSSGGGDVGTLEDGYIRKVPLPRVPTNSYVRTT